jgi:ABC-2 type transport system ATP-binding protein
MAEKASASCVIQVEELTRRFKQLVAVDKVSFDVKEGEIFGFLGPNGAGKTTTINMLCTLLKPTSGSAKVNGYDVNTQMDQVRHSIGLVFQDTTLDNYLTAEQNLYFHAYAYNVPREVRGQRIQELMQLVDLWDRRKDKILNYSGGMKRRLEIARGLLHEPKVLFLDEPTIGLDPQTRSTIWEHIINLQKKSNLTIFMTTHYMEEAENCNRIAVIDHGHIIAMDTPDKLKDAFGGDVVTLKAHDNQEAVQEIKQRYGIEAQLKEDSVSFSIANGETFLPEFVRGFNDGLLSIGLRRPTLEDVFLKLTGRQIREEGADQFAIVRQRHGMGRR